MATAWGFVEGLLDFLTVMGFWEVLDIDGQGFERKMVSVWQLLATDELKVLLGMVQAKVDRERADKKPAGC